MAERNKSDRAGPDNGGAYQADTETKIVVAKVSRLVQRQMSKEKSKKLLYWYQRLFWYVAQAKNEILKPLGFWNETILILTFLKVSGYQITLSHILIGYVIVLVVAAAVGKLIVALGIVRYNTAIANEQNSELMLILKKLEDLEKNSYK